MAILILISTSVFAEEDASFNFSFKDWYHTFTDSSSSDHSHAVVVAGTVKKGDYFATLSMLLPTTYHQENGNYQTRRDTDIALGWQLNSNLAILGGAKKVGSNHFDYSYSPAEISKSTTSVTYLGANGFKNITDNSFLYGTATRSIKASKSNQSTSSLTFTSYEAGYGYLLNKSTQLSGGYRKQTFRLDGLDINLSGFIFGTSFSF